ncbi:hypothetical protein Golob_004257 [Gossypium lobatum]|uniref:Uncharacterized protein n=1 Tax=Gossypium lobatum TaxID=34289 RepID=A0A7J8N0X1_9ROSI|nr:hypothetical protein [Gossypium lobatum]
MVLDFEEDREIPILLGRPFLATSRSIIDLEKNELTIKINGEIETFKCGHQLNGEKKLGEQCKELYVSNNPESRDKLPFINTKRINRFNEGDRWTRVEWHKRRWTNTDRMKELRKRELMILLDESGKFYVSLQDPKSRDTENRMWDMVFVRGKEVKSRSASVNGSTRTWKGELVARRLKQPQEEVGESSHPKLDWMTQRIQKLGPIFQEFARQNNIQFPNYALDMFGPIDMDK